jgi:hypothetical protein
VGIGCTCDLSKLGGDDLTAKAVTSIDSSRYRWSVRERGLGANGCVSLSTVKSWCDDWLRAAKVAVNFHSVVAVFPAGQHAHRQEPWERFEASIPSLADPESSWFTSSQPQPSRRARNSISAH